MTITPHADYEKFKELWPQIQAYQALASRHGIDDIFQDNEGKILQVLLLLNMKGVDGREGNDAVDAAGNEYELKSVNLELQDVFTTHHHLNHDIIAKYRCVPWIFAAYRGIELIAVYRVECADMEPWYVEWEQTLKTRTSINNPKIRVGWVMEVGKLLWGQHPSAEVLRLAPQRKAARRKQLLAVKKAKLAAQQAQQSPSLFSEQLAGLAQSL